MEFKFWAKLSKLFPESSLKQGVRRIFYHVAFGFTLGSYEVSFPDGTKADFHRLVFINERAGQSGSKSELMGYTGNYEIKGGDVGIIAGAYHGYSTVYAAKKAGIKGKVICFEPDPFSYKLLKKNIQLNELDNVICINKGLWSEDETLKLKFKAAGSQVTKDSKSAITEIQVVSLDNELPRLGISKVDFMWLDVEGAEIEVIKGAINTIKASNAELAVASYHIIDGNQSCIELENLFRHLGFETLTDHPLHLTTYAYKKRKTL